MPKSNSPRDLPRCGNALAAANASLAAVTKERDDAASALPAKIAEGVAARLSLKEKADGFGVEVKADA